MTLGAATVVDARYRLPQDRKGNRFMTKLTKTNAFKKHTNPVAETAIDKTTRIVRGIIDEEAEQRQAKISRLRKARLEREACPPAKPAATTPPKAGKKATAKTT